MYVACVCDIQYCMQHVCRFCCQQGEMADVVVPCSIEGVEIPLLLVIFAKVQGLSISYSLSDEPQGSRY